MTKFFIAGFRAAPDAPRSAGAALRRNVRVFKRSFWQRRTHFCMRRKLGLPGPSGLTKTRAKGGSL